MPNCPLCQTSLKDDFGLVDCPGCRAPLFIDMDGSVVSAAAANPAGEGSAELENFPMQEDHAAQELFEPEPFSENEVPQEFDQPQAAADFSAEEAAVSSPSDSLQELTDFANSEASQGKEGLLRFHLIIEGIDSGDLRRDLAQALEDKKFMWDGEELLRSVRQGRLVLQDISAVKAVTLIRRLREKPLKITWEQHAIHQA